ncbi:MAG TPA: class III extradiol dioxygenase subunit B-like domain-containing protein [bacterium]|nr:class III extradiol dioxygenase subunit B-like domain-containing protein [bacterium]
MIVSSFIVPHSPILIPNIGKKNFAILEKTSKAIGDIKNKILEEKIDTIIIISPHRPKNPDISINDHFQFTINFEEFGDYSNKTTLKGDINLSYRLKEVAEPDFWPILKAETEADYGANIPLFLLTAEAKQKSKEFKGRVIIINTSKEKDLQYHFDFGQKISSEIDQHQDRIAIIASAELSHCLNYNSPGGFYQKAILFDEKTIENIKKGPAGIEKLLKTDPKLSNEAKECGLRPIALISGIINSIDYKPETLVYQKELGVGYLTMDMGLKK